MKSWLDELKAALRGIAKRPGFSMLVVGVLGSGLACVILMLVMLDGFVIRPMPFAAPDELLHAGLRSPDAGGEMDDLSAPDLLQVRRNLADIAEVAAFSRATINLSDLERPERYDGASVSANLWSVLRVAPLLGRGFTADDERAGAPAVVMLSYELWQSRYGGDPALVGREIRMNARPATVVGVMPPGFSYPHREMLWTAAPLGRDANAPDSSYTVALRRAPGATDAAVVAALDAWFADAARAQPDRYRGLAVAVEPLVNLGVNPTLRALLGIMLAASALVLLVACANAANLLLTRALARRQELAVRSALGASRGRIVLHLLVQSTLLTLVATAFALPLAAAVAGWQQNAFRQQADGGPPLWIHLHVDAAVVAMVVAAALLTALATGLLPAMRAAGTAPAEVLRDGTRSVAGGAFARISRLLVIGEIALSCVLLIAVGTMVRGIAKLDHIDLGIDTNHLLTARAALFASAYPTGADQLRVFENLTDRLRADPEVVDASTGTVLPARMSATRELLPAGVALDAHAPPQVQYGAVDDHFLAAFGTVLQEGRFFDTRDTAGGERVAVVDRGFAERFGDGGSPLGRRFRLDPRDPQGPTVTVVGVIERLTLNAPMGTSEPTLLVPLRQDPARIASIAVRTRGDANAFAPRLNEIMRAVDADTPLYWVRDYATLIRSVTYGERVVAQWFGAFGVIALLLAGAGLYGVMAFSVGQRIREIGVRRALGAPDAQVLRDLLARSLVQFGVGIALGFALGLPFTRLLTGWLHSIERSSAGVAVAALAVLLLAAALAVALPARRALRVDPMAALRHE